MSPMTDLLPLSIDTNVVSRVISNRDPLQTQYMQQLSGRILAITYFTRAELESAEWTPEKQTAVAAFLAQCIKLDNPGEATRIWFARAKQVRARLNLDRGAEREDLWMLARTAEHRLPIISHDYNAVRVARGLGVDWSATLLDQVRLNGYFAEDDRALSKRPLPSEWNNGPAPASDTE